MLLTEITRIILSTSIFYQKGIKCICLAEKNLCLWNLLQDIAGLHHSERFQEINEEIVRKGINGIDGKSKFECLNIARAKQEVVNS